MPRPRSSGIDGQGHQLVLPMLGQALSDVDVLARKILMNEENPHESETLKRFSLVLELTQQQLQVGDLAQLDVGRQAHAHLQRQ